jgi:hypothetical protein
MLFVSPPVYATSKLQGGGAPMAEDALIQRAKKAIVQSRKMLRDTTRELQVIMQRRGKSSEKRNPTEEVNKAREQSSNV